MDLFKSKNLKDFLKEEFKKILFIFLLLYLAVFLAIKTGNAIENSITESRAKTSQSLSANFQEQSNFINKKDRILIPKIQVEAPIIFVDSTLPKDFREPLNRGVAHFPSALPGETGQTIILGHSAPSGFPRINYNWVFSELNKLEVNDEIYVIFNNRQYKYLVKEKTFLQSGQDLPSMISDGSLAELVLISCWPPGIDHKRIAIRAEIEL